MKGSRLMLLCEVRGLVVTRLDFDDADGLTLDERVAEAAGLLAHEKVDVFSETNGTRFACHLRLTDAPGELAVSGAAAYLLKPGDRVTLSTFGWMKAKAAQKHEPTRLLAGEGNELP